MAEYILNGSFAPGLEYWNNGARGGMFDYIWDSSRISDLSWGFSVAERECYIDQGFAVWGEAIQGLLSVWRYHFSSTGNQSNGRVVNRVILRKPSLVEVEIASEDTTGDTASGWLLHNEDIKSLLTEEGNYQIVLETLAYTAFNRDIYDVAVTTPYVSPWNFSGWTIDNGPTLELTTGYPIQNEEASATYDFTIVGVPQTATLTLDGFGESFNGEVSNGWAMLVVTVGKYGGYSRDVYHAYLYDGAWHTILNNENIIDIVSGPGNYYITLAAYARSGWNGYEPALASTVAFGSCSLAVHSHDDLYTQSEGQWDDVSLDILLKKTKVVSESFDAAEVTPGKKIEVNRSESVFSGSEIETHKHTYKRAAGEMAYFGDVSGVGDIVGRKDSAMEWSYFHELASMKKVRVFRSEDVKFGPEIGTKSSLVKTATEASGVHFEEISMIKKKATQSESMKLNEIDCAAMAMKSGGMIIRYNIMGQIWETAVPMVTRWLRRSLKRREN